MIAPVRDRHGLDPEGADVLLEPGRPLERELRPGLQHRRHPPSGAAAHHPDVAAVQGGEDLDDRRALAVPPRRDQDAFVAPVHADDPSAAGGGRPAAAPSVTSVGEPRLVEQRAALPVLDLDHPEVGVAPALPGERGVDLGLGALGEGRPDPRAAGVVAAPEGARRGRRGC